MLGHVVGRASEAPGAQPAGARARGGLVACLIARDRRQSLVARDRRQSLERPAVKEEAEGWIGARRLAAEPAHPALQRLVAEADQGAVPIAADHLVNELVLEEDDGVFRLRRNFEAATGGSAGWEQGEIRRRRGLKRKPLPGDFERHAPDPGPEQRGAGLPERPVVGVSDLRRSSSKRAPGPSARRACVSSPPTRLSSSPAEPWTIVFASPTGSEPAERHRRIRRKAAQEAGHRSGTYALRGYSSISISTSSSDMPVRSDQALLRLRPSRLIGSLPVLFLHAAWDAVCDTVHSRLAEPMRDDCADLTEVTVSAGHELMLERPDEVNRAIATWVAGFG